MNERIMPPPLPIEASELPEEMFRAPAKWEQNKLTHSPGYVTLSRASVEFLPGSTSVLGRHIIIPLGGKRQQFFSFCQDLGIPIAR